MNEDLNQHKKSDKIKWFVTSVVMFLVIILLVGICMQIWGSDKVKPSNWGQSIEDKTEDKDKQSGDSGFIAPEEHEANGISFKAVSIPVERYSDYGVSAAAETAVQLTVKVTPENADVSDGKFTIGFKNASSSWAKGKTLSQYVTLSQSDSTHATVSCLKAFGEQIIVTYTVSGENGNITATYPLDYAKRITTTNIGDVFNLVDSELTYNNLTQTRGILEQEISGFEYSDYTVDDTFTLSSSSYFKLTDTFKSACSSASVTLVGTNKTGSVSGNIFTLTDGESSLLDYYIGLSVAKTEAFRNVVNAQNSNGIFEVSIVMTGTYSSWTNTATYSIDLTDFPVAAQSAQLQDGNSGTSYIF